MMTPNVCDTCHDRGRCCKSFVLSYGRENVTSWNDEGIKGAACAIAGFRLPFFPVRPGDITHTDEHGREYSAWRYGCSLLGQDGRCSDYENRPDLCRDYIPTSEPLCAEFIGPPPAGVVR